MKVHRHICEKPNIGDEINSWFWHEATSKTIENYNTDSLLVGIGTILNQNLPHFNEYHILGSGFGYGNGSFNLRKNMHVHFVRGPLTAKALGISEKYAITDPAILIPDLRPIQTDKTIGVSFMPHITMDNHLLKNLIESFDINYISPSDDEQTIFNGIANSSLLITSAMHGAIFADSYRVPWLPVKTSHQILDFKWQDWTSSMKLEFNPISIPPLWEGNKAWFNTLKTSLKIAKIKKVLERAIKTEQAYLSSDSVFSSKQNSVREAISSFSSDVLK